MRRSFVTAIACAAFCCAGRAAADEATLAKERFRRALSLIDEGELEKAARELEAAYRLKPNYAVLFNLGQTYAGLSRPVESERALERYLAEGGDDIAADRRERVQRILARQKARIGTVAIDAPDGASIRIDGRSVGVAPLAAEVRVAEGRHVVSAHLEGRLVEREIDVLGGKRAPLSIAIDVSGATLGARIQIECDRPANVWLDGQLVGATPLGPQGVQPGRHEVRFVAAGFEDHAEWVVAEEGFAKTVTCGEARQVAPTVGGIPEDPYRRHRAWGYGVGAAGLSLGVASLVTWRVSHARFEDFRRTQRQLDAERAMPGADFDERARKNANRGEEVQNLDKLAVAFGASGLALVGASAILLLTSRTETPATEVSVGGDARGGWLGVRSRF